MGLCHPGQLVDTAGPQTLSRVTWKSWSTPLALESGPSSPGTSGRARGTSGTVPRFPGELVDPAAPRTRLRVARECWSTPRALVPGPCRPGQLFDTTGPRTRVRFTWES